MSLQQRAGLVVLVALSLLAMIGSILKTVYAAVAFAGDASILASYDRTAILTLALIEGDFVIIIGCAPVLRGGLGLATKRASFSSPLRPSSSSLRRHHRRHRVVRRRPRAAPLRHVDQPH